MLAIRTKPSRRPSGGVVWPGSGDSTPGEVGDVFANRPFAPHIPTVGFDNDFHRGIDDPLDAGVAEYSALGGHVIRLHRTHFGFETDAQLTYWSETDSDSTGVFSRSGSNLHIVGTRGGAKTFPATAAKFHANGFASCVEINNGDWEIRLLMASSTDLAAGKLGLALLDETLGEYVAIEWDGVNATALGVGSGGNLASHGTNLAVTAEVWLRIRLSGTTLSWDVSAAGSSWTTVDSETINATTFTDDLRPVFRPMVYWRSTDTNATPVAIDVDYVGWNENETIGRFGNWVAVSDGTRKAMQMHMTDVAVEIGDIINPGDQVGTAGSTGFDDRSGLVLNTHVHLELIESNRYSYDNDDPVNPLRPGFLPRANVSNNVTVTRSTANDPDGVSCHRLRIQVARADQDFDLNSVSLTGHLATRTINWDTRAGLNADNDIPKQDGVYIVAEGFTQASAEYEVSFYFDKTVVGTAFLSATVADTAGTTLWSETTATGDRYPHSAAEMHDASDFRGTWIAGWLCDEASGNLAAVFGSPALQPTTSSVPTHGITGPLGGIDKAVGVADNTGQAFIGGDVHDVTATDDLLLAWVGKHPAGPSSTRVFVSKRGTASAYWSVQLRSGGAGTLDSVLSDGTITSITTAAHTNHDGDVWYLGLMVLERGVGHRLATDLVTGANEAVNSLLLGNCNNDTANFCIGRAGSLTAPFHCAALYVGIGVDAADGCNANIAAMITALKAHIGF